MKLYHTQKDTQKAGKTGFLCITLDNHILWLVDNI